MWLNDAANLFRSRMDPSRQHMIAPTCDEIMVDILQRFDPRPETSISLSSKTDEEMTVIPTINTIQDFSILLRYMFRQSALDNTNNLGRTALHLLCDVNRINSSEPAIMLLLDKFGCNTSIKDKHNARPIDMIIADRKGLGWPTGTRARETVLIERRPALLTDLVAQFSAEDRVATDTKRKLVMEDCVRRATYQSQELWDASKENDDGLFESVVMVVVVM